MAPRLDPRRYDEWCDAFGLDRYPLRLSYDSPREPLFREEVLAETDTTVTLRRSDGSVAQDAKGYHKTIPREIRPAVTDRAEWERLKEWMDIDQTPPSPDNCPELAETLRRAREAATDPLGCP